MSQKLVLAFKSRWEDESSNQEWEARVYEALRPDPFADSDHPLPDDLLGYVCFLVGSDILTKHPTGVAVDRSTYMGTGIDAEAALRVAWPHVEENAYSPKIPHELVEASRHHRLPGYNAPGYVPGNLAVG